MANHTRARARAVPHLRLELRHLGALFLKVALGDQHLLRPGQRLALAAAARADRDRALAVLDVQEEERAVVADAHQDRVVHAHAQPRDRARAALDL